VRPAARARPSKQGGAPAEGCCIVCGALTGDRSQTTGRWHWRCDDLEECAVRRNAKKRRPRPESEVRAEARATLARNARRAEERESKVAR
jgi:hypothetical protein